MAEPLKRYINDGTYRLIDGIWHRVCRGISHDEPVYLPATKEYFNFRKAPGREGHIVYPCKTCVAFSKGRRWSNHSLVSTAKVLDIYDEAVNRLGMNELARRTGLSREGIQNVVYGRVSSVRGENVRKVITVLLDARKAGEFKQDLKTVQGAQMRAHGINSSCFGCGTHIDNYTDDCPLCWDRKRRRDERVKAA